MNSIDGVKVAAMILRAAQTMANARAELIELDSVIGDGDLGITMEKGFAAAAKTAEENASAEPGIVFVKVGMAIARAAPSTMGTLMATGLMWGGKAVTGKAKLDSRDQIVFLEAFLQGVTERGKAKPGEKTILDILIPAIEAMKTLEKNDAADPAALWDAAKKGAATGLEVSKNLVSQHGKAAVFREKTLGLVDPGGKALYLLIASFSDALAGLV
jgi:dihydroxyacetone kinase-like protein